MPLIARSDCNDSEVRAQGTDLLITNRVIAEVEVVEVIMAAINAKATVVTVT